MASDTSLFRAIFSKGPHMSIITGRALALFVMVCAVLPLAASSAGPDPLVQAADSLRDRDYPAAVQAAERAADSPRKQFVLGMARLRGGNPEQALAALNGTEARLSPIGDYILTAQAEALQRLGRFREAAAKTASLIKGYPDSPLVRRAEKLSADLLLEAGDSAGALKAYTAFVEKHASGADSVEALFQSGRCREETGDRTGAMQVYRGIWLNNPSSPQAPKAMERLAALEKGGMRYAPFTGEELFKRASSLAGQGDHSGALKAFGSIAAEGRSPELTARIDLRSGISHYRLRHWSDAGKCLTRAAASRSAAVRSEARFWAAKALERQDMGDRASALYMELAGEGRKQEYADDALMEAAGLRRGQGKYQEAALLYQRIGKEFPESKHVSRSLWETAWCRYLGGEYPAAVELLRPLTRDDGVREKAVYWLARSLERSADPEAAGWYRVLQDEYPAGFYASWYRQQKGIRDTRESLGRRTALTEIPALPGYERIRLLAALGLADEARSEMAAVRKKAGDNRKQQFPGLLRLCLEIGDYNGGISLFLQNRPVPWDTASLPLWGGGYPLVYASLVREHAAAQGLSEGLVYALVRAESGFSPAVKSPAGAVGLMQLMPGTARMVSGEGKAFDPARLTEPEYNIRLGTRHLRDLVKSYDGETVYAAAAYNAGAAALERWRKNLKGLEKDEFIECIPYQETRDYVKKVYASAATYRQLYGLK